MNSSTSSVNSVQPGPSGAAIADRIGALAASANRRGQFWESLAQLLRDDFGASLVVMEASDMPAPIVIAGEHCQPPAIADGAMGQLLASASAAPIACDIPPLAAEAGAIARGMRVELSSEPGRAAVLLVYPDDHWLTAETQIGDLRLLDAYAHATRDALKRFPGDVESPCETAAESIPATSGQWMHLRGSMQIFHRDLDLTATCYRIACETRRLLGCDRVTVLVPCKGRWTAEAVSGVAVVDSRSNRIRAIERLTAAAVVMGRPLELPHDEPLPPQIQGPLEDYLDEADVLRATLLPLYAPIDQREADEQNDSLYDPFDDRGEPVGVIVLESFSSRAPAANGSVVPVVAAEAALALGNSLQHNLVFGLRTLKSLGRFFASGRTPRLKAVFALLAVLILASMLIRVEHYVVATGHVEPTSRRDVFASVDGIVKELHVRDGDTVAAGDVLMELENAELESRAESLAGQIQTAVRRLASIRAVRLNHGRDGERSSRLALEQRQIESELENLRRQQGIIRSQQKDLVIRSPIKGTVIGWQLQRRLASRPISRGNRLVSVADHRGPWSIRLRIPDRDAGPVLSAVKEREDVEVEFAVATRPSASYAATLQTVSAAARVDPSGQHVIDGEASVRMSSGDDVRQGVDDFTPAATRAGADVTAKIACGKRSLLASWFGDVVSFVHRNILFYL